MESLHSAVVLSRGGTWKPETVETPYLLPTNNGLKAWPDGSYATITFSGTDGTELLSLDGEVEPNAIRFLGDPDDMDQIPAGAGFAIILETLEGPFPIRHGKVIRKEVQYTTPLAQQDVAPLSIADNFQRTALGRKWKLLFGALKMVDNSGSSLPIGVAANGANGAMRYEQQFTGSAIEIGVSLLNMNTSTAAWTSINFCADINFEMGYAVKFETGSSGHRLIHIGTLTGPMTIIDRAPTVVNTVVNNDYYLIRYLPTLKTVSVYKGTSLEPLTEWIDSTDIVPLGPGYWHLGASFNHGASNGIQLTSMTARDAA